MRRIALIVLGAAVAMGCNEIAKSAAQVPAVAVKLELTAIGKAEQRYLVENSAYGTIEQLQKADLLPGDPDRNGYTFKLEVSGSESFSATASPADEKNKAWPTYAIDQTQEIKTTSP